MINEIKTQRVWIAWEYQRRSIELSKKLNCKLYVINHEGILRYPLSIMKTLLIFFHTKPQILFVQNPSMILTALSCVLCRFWKVRLIVDRHTTFLIDKRSTRSLKRRFFLTLHFFTLRNAFLTIITNDHLANLVLQAKGKPFVLPDPLPTISPVHLIQLRGKRNVLFPSSFGEDEPLQPVIEAMRLLVNDNIVLYITGNSNKFDHSLKKTIPSNIELTGYLSQEEYINLLFSVDAVIALTSASNCMLCGCYEAVAAGKPLITSNKKVLTEYFTESIFVDNTSVQIVNSIRTLFESLEDYKKKVQLMKSSITTLWNSRFGSFEKMLAGTLKDAVN